MSDHLQLFAKEQERNKLLYSSAAQASDAAPATPKSASTSKSAARKNTKKSAAKKKSGREEDKDAEEVPQMCNADDDGLDGKGGNTMGKVKSKNKDNRRQKQSDIATLEVDMTAISKQLPTSTGQ